MMSVGGVKVCGWCNVWDIGVRVSGRFGKLVSHVVGYVVGVRCVPMAYE